MPDDEWLKDAPPAPPVPPQIGAMPLPWWVVSDPRVPSESDPTDDMFRVQLCVTMLQVSLSLSLPSLHPSHRPHRPHRPPPPPDLRRLLHSVPPIPPSLHPSHRPPQTCGAYFTAGANRIRLVRFLHKLQRYLFCKPDPPRSVEFAVLDMIDDMEMQMRKLDLKKETKR